MKKISLYIITKLSIIILILIYGCCAPSTELSKYEQADILAKNKFNVDYKMVKNESDTYVLCYKIYEKKNQPHSSLHYFVYDLNQKEIVYEEKLYDSNVKWIDDHNIEIKITPEVISGDDDVTVFILNVLTKEKQKSNFTN